MSFTFTNQLFFYKNAIHTVLTLWYRY